MKFQFSIIQLLNKLLDRQDLSINESKLLMEEIFQGRLTFVQIAAFLIALRMKGESIDELLGFITIMRKHMVKIKTDELVIDTCGTGGDGKQTFNISTAVAFVVAGAGVSVAKHGNRNASSLCGSADVLEALGVNINLTQKQAEEMLKKTGFTFLFAPLFHPAMKHVGLARKELKIRTVFNFLGPFINPAGVKRQIIGVPSIILAEKLSQVAANLKFEHLMIISSEDGLDEISLSAPTHVFEIKGKKVKKMIINPIKYGFKNISLKEIQGGDAETNARIIRNIFNDKEGPQKNIVVLNSAAALLIAGKVENFQNGIELARDSIENGYAQKVLEQAIEYSISINRYAIA